MRHHKKSGVFKQVLMRHALLMICLCSPAAPAVAQNINLPAEMADEAALPRVMPRFAEAVIGSQEDGRTPDLASLFRAQLVAGLYGDAIESLVKLRSPLSNDPSPRVRARYWEYVLYASSALRATQAKSTFQDAYRETFRALIRPLDNRTAAVVINGLTFDKLSQANQALAQDLGQLKGKSALSLAESLKLIGDYNEREIYRAFASTTAELAGEDDARRYTIQKEIAIATPDHGTICALLVRAAGHARLPALLQFTIYNDAGTILREARRVASNDYAAVIGLTRGKGCSLDPVVPYEHDGEDAAFLVDWIAAQPWSDGQVGMFGGSYSGFTAWAAVKHQPKALKAIMVGAPVAPGIDVPQEGNVFWNFIYPWPFYTTNNKTLDNATYYDNARWRKLNQDWYSSGRPYRDLDKIDGTPNPIFDRWISHPAYDAYWHSLIPYKEEFSKISIPVLETAGYYYGGPGAAVYYLSQHMQYRPNAQHYLLIGPYDHLMAQRGTANAEGDVDTLSGYPLDAAAKIDLVELRFKWFDHVLKGGPKPAILEDKINYEVTGANSWKHAPSLAAMANDSQRYYLSADPSGRAHRLTAVPQRTASMHQTIDFADRRDVDVQSPGGGVQDNVLDSTNGLVFISEPLTKATELSGLFSGHLDFIANKSDFDFQVALYELTAAKDYIQLAPYWSRASYVKDLAQRSFLTPGKRHSLDFRSRRLMSRQMGVGSRVVAVLSILKEPEREINYGTGKEVIDESISDGNEPLRMTWFSSSYLNLPVYKQGSPKVPQAGTP